MNEIVKLAIDNYHGSVEKYSKSESNEVLRQALVDLNGGSTKLDYKAIRDGKCQGLFALLEEILSKTVVEGLTSDMFFSNLVEYRDVALGDQNIFYIEDSDLYYVAEAAEGTQGIRRQRLHGLTEVTIPTSLKVVKIYEEMNRVLAGRVDFNDMISKVSNSFEQQLLNEIYAAWIGATADDLGDAVYYASGTYDEDTMLDLIAHVEAASGGKEVTIMGTKKAVRNLVPGIQGIDSESDIYNMGYYGKFYGSNVVVTPQRHKIGSTEFALDDNLLTVVAGDHKPIKVVREGEPLIITGDPLLHGDLTYEYLYAERFGSGIVMATGNTGLGKYELA